MLGVEDNLQCVIVLVISLLVSLMKDEAADLKKYSVESIFLGEEHDGDWI